MNKTTKALLNLLLALALIALAGLILAFPVKWLWNALLPDLFGFKTITAWQALGLVVLGRMMFGSSGNSSKKEE